jgi:phosphate-selective porin OprO and OprP
VLGIEIFRKRPVHLGIVLAFLCLLLLFAGPLLAEPPASEPNLPFEEMIRKELEKGFNDPVGFHYYFKDGFRMESPEGRLKTKIGGEARLDGGYLSANETLKRSFSDLPGWKGNFRELKLRLSGTFLENWKFQFDMDFANVRQIKDIWISYEKIPFIGEAKAGHTKVPFSLEGFMSNSNRTFMEVALPVEAFFPGRNIGILCRNAILNDRMTWAAGYFLISGSFSDVAGATDYLSDAFGSSVNLRVTGLTRYEDDGKNLLHFGFSYSHQFRDATREESQLKLRAHPESRLTDDTFVNTGQFYTEAVDLFGYEAAMVQGPLSVQGELFHVLTNAESVGDPRFWGVYVYGSYCLTGEHRSYDRSKGIFKGVKPKNDFQFTADGWGALEAALRLSYVDLNDREIRGGTEIDVTAGLNWYLNGNTRIIFNYVHARVMDRIEPPIDGGNAHIFQVRFQYKL